MKNDTFTTWLAFSTALFAAFAVSAKVTDGYQAFTLESARRLEALRAPRPIGSLRFTSLSGEPWDLDRYRGQWVLVDFIYTRCQTLCSSMGSVYSRLQQRLSKEIASGKIQLLSVSFDPAQDGAAQLVDYRARHGGSAAGWDMARPYADEVPLWLKQFGVLVIPDEFGGFAHNAAIHLIGPEGRLQGIFDFRDVDEVIRHVQLAR